MIYKANGLFLSTSKRINILILALIVFSFESAQVENNYFTQSSIQITTAQNSPAFAALEDLNQSYTHYVLDSSKDYYESNPLTWGENKNLWVLQNYQLIKYTATARELNPMHISSSQIIKQNVDPFERVLTPPAEVLFEQPQKITKIDDESIHPERVRVANQLMAQHSAAVIEEYGASEKTPLESLIEEESKNTYQGPKSLLISGNKLTQVSNEQIQAQPVYKKDKYEKHFNNYMLRGSILFDESLNEWDKNGTIKIYRKDVETLYEEAYVNFDKRYYEVHLSELTGYLVAEMYDSQGDLTAMTEIDLLAKDLSKVKSNEIVIRQDLKLVQVSSILTVKAISGESTSKQTVSLKSKDINGQLKREQLSVQLSVDGLDDVLDFNENYELTSDMFTKDSKVLLKAEAKNNWGSLAIGLGHSDIKMRLYRNSLVDALLDNYQKNHEGYGVVWGRVVDQNGLPIEGAQVEIAGDLAVGPFYFNQAHLVDYKLNRTNYDGLFAFIKVLPGLQAVRASVNGIKLPVELTIADSGNVSYLELKASPPKHTSVMSYNPLTGNKVDTSIKFVGSDEIYETFSDEKNIEIWQGGEGVTLLESDPGSGYELTRQLISRSENHQRVPVVATSWISNLLNKKGINLSPNTTMIVGFIQGDSFEVFANADLDGWSNKDILYFDGQGRVLPKSLGQAGGGFIMYNVPEAISSVSILAKNSNKVFTSLVFTEQNIVSVLQTNLQ